MTKAALLVRPSTMEPMVKSRTVGDQPAPTPNSCKLPRRLGDFATFGDALDYAATGTRGFNFHDPRGSIVRAYPFAELREDALAVAYRLIAHRS